MKTIFPDFYIRQFQGQWLGTFMTVHDYAALHTLFKLTRLVNVPGQCLIMNNDTQGIKYYVQMIDSLIVNDITPSGYTLYTEFLPIDPNRLIDNNITRVITRSALHYQENNMAYFNGGVEVLLLTFTDQQILDIAVRHLV